MTVHVISSRLVRLFLPLVALTGAIGFAGAAHAYVLEGPKWVSSPVFQLELGSPGFVLADGNTSWNSAAAPALGLWNQVIGRIQLGQVVGSTVPISSGDRYNSMSFARTVFGKSFGANALAVTYYTYSASSMGAADILFNQAQSWNSYRGPLRFDGTGHAIADIQRVALHELGHAIGLNHPDDAGQHVAAIMNSTISDRYTLSNDDIAGGRVLYGAPTSSSGSGAVTKNIFWQNSVTGDRQIWVMNGTTHAGTAGLARVSTSWNIAAIADFNGDAQPDILWQYVPTGQCTVWLLRNTTVIGSIGFPAVPLGWQVATAADFNGDAKPDVILQNRGTGQRVLWLLNRTTVVGALSLGFVEPTWNIVASGDFNGDGHSDIVWQNLVTGQGRLWLMNRTRLASNTVFTNVGPDWQIAGTADFNLDGKRDLVWQNRATGQRYIWLMNRTAILAGGNLGIVPWEWQIRNH